MTEKLNPTIAIGAAALVSVLTSTTAATAQANNSRGWYKVCSEQNETKICNVQYQVVAGTGQVVTSVNLAELTGKINRRVFQITVPTGRLLPPGLELQIDNKQKTKIPYVFCAPRTCAAEVKLDDNLVKVLKAGGEMTIVSRNVQGQPNPIKVTLQGFTKAYDGPPLKQDELQSQQKQLEEQLKKKAEETRKKLQEAQEKAKN